MSDGPPHPADLKDEQARRAQEERGAAAQASTEDEAWAHQRRAEKAGYLRDKLSQQEETEG